MQIAPPSVILEMSTHFGAEHRVHRESSWYWYQEGGKGGAIPFAVEWLYRGQNKRYLPMRASIARGLDGSGITNLFDASIADQAQIVLRVAQAWWFAGELKRHPIASNASGQRVELNEIALAQHYGIPTGYLDLTDDFNVGAFFATCRETTTGWEPIESGIGIIYRVNLRGSSEALLNYIPLGPQRLPRPYEQCAWVTELPFCHSFEGWPGVEILQFHHERSLGEYFLDMFDGGRRLFPEDPLSDVAAEILGSNQIPRDLVDAAIESFANDPCGIVQKDLPTLREKISELVRLVDGRAILTDAQIAALHADAAWRFRMLSPVKARAVVVRRIPVEQEKPDGDSESSL